MDYQFLASGTRRGGPLYLIDGLGHVRNAEVGDKLYLHCRLRMRHGCRATAVLDRARDAMTAYGRHTCTGEMERFRGSQDDYRNQLY